jgi:hypothetical protein
MVVQRATLLRTGHRRAPGLRGMCRPGSQPVPGELGLLTRAGQCLGDPGVHPTATGGA